MGTSEFCPEPCPVLNQELNRQGRSHKGDKSPHYSVWPDMSAFVALTIAQERNHRLARGTLKTIHHATTALSDCITKANTSSRDGDGSITSRLSFLRGNAAAVSRLSVC